MTGDSTSLGIASRQIVTSHHQHAIAADQTVIARARVSRVRAITTPASVSRMSLGLRYEWELPIGLARVPATYARAIGVCTSDDPYQLQRPSDAYWYLYRIYGRYRFRTVRTRYG